MHLLAVSFLRIASSFCYPFYSIGYRVDDYRKSMRRGGRAMSFLHISCLPCPSFPKISVTLLRWLLYCRCRLLNLPNMDQIVLNPASEPCFSREMAVFGMI